MLLDRTLISEMPSIQSLVAVSPDSNAAAAIQSDADKFFSSKSILLRRLLQYREPNEKHDLVLSNMALASQPNRIALQTLAELWELTAQNLVLIENSSVESASFIQRARQTILDLDADAHVFAPYASLSANMLHKYSYVVLQRGKRQNPAHLNPANKADSSEPESRTEIEPPTHFDTEPSRLILTPLKRTGHVILDGCMPSGFIERRIISKRHGKEMYRTARKSVWGDLVEVPVADEKKREEGTDDGESDDN
ncbi:hypothetical protein CcCBS67573_g00866 [Chytriomyces confervae]|uniref:Uncharacterized protein n=1 Tax=Chytriomyces confervae TaxID=246404 RepID=A0A507FRC9_9FUNG|nr:hypothetical protein CcCBS67573_g00866 [Chytriomyces confervae]